MKTNWSDYEVFMKPIHLKGQAVTLTIVRAVEEDTHPRGGEIVKSPVLYFRELPFGLILSPTNRQTLAALYGDAVAGCIGKPIVVRSMPVKVGRIEKTPIRILNQRPNAPKIEPETGEIVSPAEASIGEPVTSSAAEATPGPTTQPEPPVSELDKYLGPRASAEGDWPKTETEFTAWLKAKGWNGQETRQALGGDAKTWLRKNPSQTWADVAMQVSEKHGGKS